MDFEVLMEAILYLVNFVKPVGALLSCFFQGLFSNIAILYVLFFVFVSLVLLRIFIDILTDLAGK